MDPKKKYRVSFPVNHHSGKGLDFVGEFHNNPHFGAGTREFAHVAATEPQVKWMVHAAPSRAFSTRTGQLRSRTRYENKQK